MKKNLPNLFIVGAPRAGTTALFHYLGQHPEVFVPHIKEPHYFGSDLQFAIPRISYYEYLSLYKFVENEKVICDGSVMYLMSIKSAEEIKTICPNSKIIIMLRHPVDLIVSLHRKMLFTGNENIVNLDEALEAEKHRQNGTKIPPLCKMISLLYYSEVLRFSSQVKRFLCEFGPDNLHIILYDNFVASTEQVYSKVLDFLNISSIILPKFEVINSSKYLRYKFIRDFKLYIKLKSSPNVKKAYRQLLPINIRSEIDRKLNLLIRKNVGDIDIAFAFKKDLQNKFKNEIIALSKIINKDLTMWLNKYV